MYDKNDYFEMLKDVIAYLDSCAQDIDYSNEINETHLLSIISSIEELANIANNISRDTIGSQNTMN